MRNLLVATLTMSAVAAAAAQTRAPGIETARSIAEQIETRDVGRDSRMQMTMRLFDRQGRVRARTLVLTALRGDAKTASSDRVLIRFLAPNDIKGTGFLVWEHDGRDDERFLYLPSVGRVRRIACS